MEWLVIFIVPIIISGMVYALQRDMNRDVEDMWEAERKRMPPPYCEDEK